MSLTVSTSDCGFIQGGGTSIMAQNFANGRPRFSVGMTPPTLPVFKCAQTNSKLFSKLEDCRFIALSIGNKCISEARQRGW